MIEHMFDSGKAASRAGPGINESVSSNPAAGVQPSHPAAGARVREPSGSVARVLELDGEPEPQTIRAAVAALKQQVARLDPEVLHPEFATELVKLFAEGERVCAAGKALSARRVAQSGAWRTSGDRSAAHWMAKTTGASVGEAVGILETGRRLAELPATDQAVREGKLSPVQARHIASAAGAASFAEEELLKAAEQESVGELKERCARLRASSSADERARHERLRKSRYLRHWTDSEGAFRLDGRFTPEAGALVLSAVEPYKEAVFRRAREAGRKESFDAYMADALLAMAQDCREGRVGSNDREAWVPARGYWRQEDCFDPEPNLGSTACHGRSKKPGADSQEPDRVPTVDDLQDEASGRKLGSRSTGEPGLAPGAHCPGGAALSDYSGSAAAGGPKGARPKAASGPDHKVQQDSTGPPKCGCGHRARVGPSAMIHVRVDHSALVRGNTEPGEVCEIPGIGPIPVATVRAMESDAYLSIILTDGADVKAVCHSGRHIPARLRTALVNRDPVCVVPGCSAREHLQIDHIQPFAEGGPTRLDNLARMCGWHHYLKTHQGYRLGGKPGQWKWIGYAPSGAQVNK